jgi:hypothetical protein
LSGRDSTSCSGSGVSSIRATDVPVRTPFRRLLPLDARLEHAAARPVIVPEAIVCDHGRAYLSKAFRSACRAVGINLQLAHTHTATDKPVIERTLQSVGSQFAQFLPGFVCSSVERRGRDADTTAVWSMAELQELLDEWVVALWQNRPHNALRHPPAPGRPQPPNGMYAAVVEIRGFVAVPRRDPGRAPRGGTEGERRSRSLSILDAGPSPPPAATVHAPTSSATLRPVTGCPEFGDRI